MNMENFIDKWGGMIADLYFRWQDEKEYEDINDYGAHVAKQTGLEVVKSTKRPFGFHLKSSDKVIHLMAKMHGSDALEFSWKEVR